ncbi:MAG TPA: DUF167 domain-containing protein [Gemmatales bacterium]|nr:DUF167 domain-containing protein [Gemmatales bacterium]
MLRNHPEGVLLCLRVQPGSRKEGILGVHADRLKVAVHAAPEKGKANAAVIDVLAKALGLAKNQIVLQQGATNQNKVVLLMGVTLQQTTAMLATFMN